MPVRARNLGLPGAACLLLVMATLFACVTPVLGHAGGDPVISEAPAGPYLLYVWLEPNPPAQGEQHVTVSVNLSASGTASESEPVLNAAVTVTAIPQPSEESDRENLQAVSAVATHAQATNKLFYEARLDLAGAGPHLITVNVEADAGSAEYEFPAEVSPKERQGILQKFLSWLRQLFA